ncbi:hypothetical protein N7532_007517 [Penicillium argentinense]|uniref:DUF7598 domain-containing protein n=1 Tax=Penicillium argentinense TaxID=1131581 RepID=A0A9W9F7U4_9EURO|nr:uncharacterized protein N7532_007517 [Penicillium argentinense]KAJ5095226.1 hypothetical protein N7532_007517 [Penicillium argentinense]
MVWNKDLDRAGFVVLNAIRALNIIVFLDIIASCVVMEVKINMKNGYFFFMAVTHAVMALLSIALIITELPLFRGYINKNWPAFGDEAGFIVLGAIMMILGVAVLGNLNMEEMSQKSLGLAFWRIVISAGILAMVMSVMNVLATFIFSHRNPRVSARQVRAEGAQAKNNAVSRSDSQRSQLLSIKRIDSSNSYTPPPYQPSKQQRFTQRISRFLPVNPSGFSKKEDGAANGDGSAHLQPPMNDAASSIYSRPDGITRPQDAYDPTAVHPLMRNGASQIWPSFRSLGRREFPPHLRIVAPLTANSVKSVLIFFAPIIIPRLINSYRSLRASIATSPPPRPIPEGAHRALNVLFASIAFFLILSLPFNPHAPEPNVFTLTRSRINTPHDVIFNRLARLRPGDMLTEADLLLKSKLTSLFARKVYLTYGPDSLTSCQFCTIDNMYSYLLYYLPFNVLLPHLIHLSVLGVATSSPIAGPECSRWRNKFTLAGLALAAFDIYIVSTFDVLHTASAAVRAGQTPPSGFYYGITLMRPLALTVFDVSCAALIYLSSTNRFFFKPPNPADQLDQAVSAALRMLNGANGKLHAASVTRNAVVRDKNLKQRDDVYWQTMVAVENPTRSPGERAGPVQGGTAVVDNIWEEPEVAQAMSRAMAGQGGVDLAQLGTNAHEFVRGVTQGLD